MSDFTDIEYRRGKILERVEGVAGENESIVASFRVIGLSGIYGGDVGLVRDTDLFGRMSGRADRRIRNA